MKGETQEQDEAHEEKEAQNDLSVLHASQPFYRVTGTRW